MEEAGYRVTVAHDGEQALALQARDPADVLLTDLQMPRLDGQGLIRVLRAEHPMLPVIVMTGAPDPSSFADLRGAAAGTIIMVKPVGPQPVLTALRNLLGVR
ncbi:response regulator [Azospirillum rugosum]|uniref:response regulator n=1 Tax=Azospirillum rugosum TaxID=416170 RepID=UPI001FE445E8|nr:response regulator [Azospirillum rugosum]